MTDQFIIKVGTINGRHPLPVDQYLVHETDPGQVAYDNLYRAADKLAAELSKTHKQVAFHLYYTGLTEATLGALDALREWEDELEFNVFVWRFDVATNTYVQLNQGKPAPIASDVIWMRVGAEEAYPFN